MSVSEIIQAALVFVLAVTTGYYAWQTRRQARLLNEQIEENRQIRFENRELEIRTIALNNIKSLVLEFEEIVFLVSTGLGIERRNIGKRLTRILIESDGIRKYAKLFSPQFKKKVKLLVERIDSFQTELISRKIKDDEKIFAMDTEEDKKLIELVVDTICEVNEEVIKEQIKLFTDSRIYKQ